MGVQLVKTSFKGPLPQGAVGLILGRASTALKGLTVIPGVVDSDFTGSPQIMVQSQQGTLVIAEGDKLAQLLLLPSLHAAFPSRPDLRGDRGFGSSGEIFEGLHMSLENRPMLTLKVQGRPFLGLLDTGADRSIIRQQDWPASWSLCKAEEILTGIGQCSAPMISASALHWADDEGHHGSFQPFVLALPVSLWGRDVLTQMDLTLTTNYSKTAKDLLKGMGYVPGKGLGASLQGRPAPVQTIPNPGRQGLGFSRGPLREDSHPPQ